MAFRQKLTDSGCSFDAAITADYGEMKQDFQLRCTADKEGNMEFEVLQPESISGITGSFFKSEGKLTFDDKAVVFSLMAEGQISPVSAPWVMLRALRGGYLSSCAEENGRLRISIDDSYEQEALGLEIWLDVQNRPVYCEIIWQGRVLLSISVENFEYV